MTEPMSNWDNVIILNAEQWKKLNEMLKQEPRDLPRLLDALDNDPFID